MTSQRRTLEFYTALRLLQPSWAGTFLLGVGLAETGRVLAHASLAVGAASLFLEPDRDHLRTAQREGCSTFTVNTLNEALRALKNEIRQGRAITVALSGDSSAWLDEIVERGVQPQYLALCRDADLSACNTLQARGARSLGGFALRTLHNATDLSHLLKQPATEGWNIAENTALTLSERRTQDAQLLASLSGNDPMTQLARQWLRTAPVLFPRALDRATWTRNPGAPSSPRSG